LTVTAPYHPPVKYSVTINRHQTSISLEPIFWDMLNRAAQQRGIAVNALVSLIDAERIGSAHPCGLASAIRVWLVSDAVARPAMESVSGVTFGDAGF
jgi:predicted DNA-binding ribbon-helix-helix protein